jgi:hypothetical protein
MLTKARGSVLLQTQAVLAVSQRKRRRAWAARTA